jgi:hypothetical protein
VRRFAKISGNLQLPARACGTVSAMTSPSSRFGPDPLETAFIRLHGMLPARLGRTLYSLHHPDARYLRIPLGILFIVSSMFWFLPVVGLEFLPFGLLLIAQDVPFLRAPVGKGMLRLLDRLERAGDWWKKRRAHR